MIRSFIRYDNNQQKMYLSCGLYAFVYSFLSCWGVTIFVIMYSRIYMRAAIKENRISTKLRTICAVLSGLTDDTLHWDNPILIKRLRRKKIASLTLLFIIPPVINYMVYSFSLNGKIYTTIGVANCKPYANIVSIIYYVFNGLFCFLLLLNMEFKYDIFRLKTSLYAYMIAYFFYGSAFLIDFLYVFVAKQYLFSWEFMAIYLTFITTTYTLFPVYLSTKKKDSSLTIEKIWKDRNSRNRFKYICTASFCGNYITFLQDYELLDISKPLLVQKMAQKYFNRDSPFYLDLLLESFNSWYLDLKHPDQYTFKTIKLQLMQFLQINVVAYMDSDTLVKDDIET